MSKLSIIALGNYCQAVDVEEDQKLPDLKSVLKQECGIVMRRITRMTQLALLGSSRCKGEIKLPKNTGVYFCSCRGDTGVTVDLLDELVKRREPPSPLTFVNSVSNAASFYVAKIFDLHDRSHFITNRFDPIAAALKTAQLDLESGEIQAALVGSVDCCSLPLSDHKRRLEIDPKTVVGEASHWLLLTKAAEKEPLGGSLGDITRLKNFSDLGSLLIFLEAEISSKTSVFVEFGQHVLEMDKKTIVETVNDAKVLNYRETLPHYDSQTASGIMQFLELKERGTLFHINSDPAGRFSLIEIEVK
ncbi:beta-ketoacyl synthase chain length factor [Aurantivibrio infirmus]